MLVLVFCINSLSEPNWFDQFAYIVQQFLGFQSVLNATIFVISAFEQTQQSYMLGPICKYSPLPWRQHMAPMKAMKKQTKFAVMKVYFGVETVC